MSKINKRKKEEFDRLMDKYASVAENIIKNNAEDGFVEIVPYEVNRDSYRFLTSFFGCLLLASSLTILIASIYVFTSAETSTFVTLTDGDVFPIRQYESIEGAISSVAK